MRSKEYWERRAAERMVNYQADAERTANEIGRAYYQSQEYIKSEINKVFSGFQKGFSLSEEEARDILDASDDATAMTVLRDAAMKIADPVERDKALAALSSPAYQYRINRLDAIKRNIAATCNSLYRTELKADSSFLSSEIVKAYQNTIFDVQKGTGVSGAFDIIPQSKIDAIMSRKWLGTHYSERIWNNTGKLAEELKGDLMAGFLTGKSEQQMTTEIAQRYQTSFFNARRLVRTECTYVTGQAELHSYTEMGVEEYEFSAILDKSTSKICKRLDGKKFKVSKAKPGTNYPPMHPFCRSVANAVLPSEEELDDMWGDTADAIGADVDFDEWVKNLEKTPDGKWKYQKPNEFVETVEPKKPAFVPAESIEEAESFAKSVGIRHVDYSDLPLETANLLNEAALTLPEDARPAFVGSGNNLQKVTGAKFSRSSKDYYGVHLDAQDFHFGEYPNIEYDFDGGQAVGISNYYKTADKIEKSKIKGNAEYAKRHDGHTQFFNTDGRSTGFHEMGHIYDDVNGIPEGFIKDAERWAAESRCDMLKNPHEAWAEAWGAYHTKNPDLPDYIAKYVHERTNTPLDNFGKSGIIEVRKESNTTGIGMYRKRDPGKITPMPNKQFQRIKRRFKALGGVIQQNEETDVYLIKNHCEGITYNENTVLLMQKPSRASVFEELIHTAQYRDGKIDGTPKSRILCEIEAQKKLIKNAKAYKLTKREVEQTKRALSAYEQDLEDLMKRGGG